MSGFNISQDGWSDAALDYLRTVWGVLRTAEIARRMNTTVNSICGKAHRKELPTLPNPVSQKSGGEPRKPRRAPKPAPLPSFAAPLLAPVPTAVYQAPKSEPCCYVVSEGRPHRYCEAPSKLGSPYCPPHHKLCYTRVAPPPPTSLDRPVMLYGRLVR